MQNFLPKPGTAMRGDEPCPPEDHLRAIALARLVLPADVHVQAPPNLSDAERLGDLLDAGIDDWGGVSPVTIDHVNPERPWPALDVLREATEERGLALAPRLTVYPEFAAEPDRWLDPATGSPVLDRSDAEGWAATTRGRSGPSVTRRPPTSAPAPRWSRSAAARPPGTPAPTPTPPACSPRPRIAGSRGRRVRGGARPACAPARSSGEAELVTLFGARGPEVAGRRRAGRRAARRGRRRHRHLRRQPQHQLHQRVHLPVHVLRVLQGPAVAQPARQALPADPRRHRRARASRPRRAARPRCACRAASTPPSTATSTSTSPAR